MKPLHVTYVPINGGRIEPPATGEVTIASFYDSHGRLLVFLTSPQGGESYQTQEYSGEGGVGSPLKSRKDPALSRAFNAILGGQ